MADRRWLNRWLLTACAVGILAGPALAQNTGFTQTHSRSQYVHRIPLLDEDKRTITPDNPRPYSPATTCGKCHEYKAIAEGHHFNAILEDSPDGRRGEPWILTDLRSGTQLPVSYRDWEGLTKPADAGLSEFDFVKAFGPRFPGGGPGEHHDAEAEGARWKVAGQLQVDCMICHARGSDYKVEDWAEQIGEENLAWAPTVAAGLAEVKGSTERLPDDYDVKTDPDTKAPVVTYDPAIFDTENKVFVDIVLTPDNPRPYSPTTTCGKCHEYKAIAEGHHFNAILEDSTAGRRGQPWIL
ncbi:MAG: hypothetical protein ACYTGQ_04455, partial [Planctomycetota bacterium]